MLLDSGGIVFQEGTYFLGLLLPELSVLASGATNRLCKELGGSNPLIVSKKR